MHRLPYNEQSPIKITIDNYNTVKKLKEEDKRIDKTKQLRKKDKIIRFTIFREEAASTLGGFHARPLSWSNWNLFNSWDSEVSELGALIKHYLKDGYELGNFK